MSISSATNQVNLQRTLSTQNMRRIPNDLEKVVGKVYLKAIDIISKIKAFFLALFYGKLSSWKDFESNINRRFEEISEDKKFKLYDKYKEPELSYGDTLAVGYRTESDEEANALKESNKNLKEYKEFKIKFTDQELEIIKPFLEEISSKETLNASNILIDLNKIFTSENISKDVKDLIDQKLSQLPEYQTLKKNLKEKLDQKRLDQIKKENQIKRNRSLKKAAIITAIAIATLGVGLLLYQYQYFRVPASILSPDLSSTIKETISSATNGTDLMIPGDPKSWFDFKILGRTSHKDVKNVFWNVGEFLIKRPYEITKNSKFLIRP
ncbi:MAG: hypothetical protein K1060chlam4_00318 [Candidatus Anoxychlamydiales bacterium]|nr:hypothetical protein [Candidatus Anoxychlamydiales bacterium]